MDVGETTAVVVMDDAVFLATLIPSGGAARLDLGRGARYERVATKHR